MSTDHNEAMRPNMNDRSEREFMGRMESNHAKLTEFSQVVGSFTQDYQRLYATYTSYREMLREVIAERDKLRESYSFDTSALIEVCAERDQLRAEVERLRADSERLAAPTDLMKRLDASIAWLECGAILPGTSACIGLEDIKALKKMLEGGG